MSQEIQELMDSIEEKIDKLKEGNVSLAEGKELFEKGREELIELNKKVRFEENEIEINE